MPTYLKNHRCRTLLKPFHAFACPTRPVDTGVPQESARRTLKTLAAALLLFALIRGLTDTQNFDLSFPLWLMTMLSILPASQAATISEPTFAGGNDDDFLR